jgi:hypothetical protein
MVKAADRVNTAVIQDPQTGESVNRNHSISMQGREPLALTDNVITTTSQNSEPVRTTTNSLVPSHSHVGSSGYQADVSSAGSVSSPHPHSDLVSSEVNNVEANSTMLDADDSFNIGSLSINNSLVVRK